MRKKALRKDERKNLIVNWFAIRIQHDNEDYASQYEIARGIGMTPSTHVSNILQEMVGDGSLERTVMQRSGRWDGYGYRLKSGSFQRPARQTIPLKFTVKGVQQLELL